MAEKIVGPLPFHQAESLLAKLIYDSGAFSGGSYPVVGRLKKSYGYKKVIGIQSFDKKVRTRIDYDPDKGYHFNFENDYTGEKICILINNLTRSQYENYINKLTVGRGRTVGPKRPIIPREDGKTRKTSYSYSYYEDGSYFKEKLAEYKKSVPSDIVDSLSVDSIDEFTIYYLIECYNIDKMELEDSSIFIDDENQLDSFTGGPKRR